MLNDISRNEFRAVMNRTRASVTVPRYLLENFLQKPKINNWSTQKMSDSVNIDIRQMLFIRRRSFGWQRVKSGELHVPFVWHCRVYESKCKKILIMNWDLNEALHSQWLVSYFVRWYGQVFSTRIPGSASLKQLNPFQCVSHVLKKFSPRWLLIISSQQFRASSQHFFHCLKVSFAIELWTKLLIDSDL